MKKFIIVVFLLQASVIFAGSWVVSGGGQSVMDINGNFRFLDLLDDYDISQLKETKLPNYPTCTSTPLKPYSLPKREIKNELSTFKDSFPAIYLAIINQLNILENKSFLAYFPLDDSFRDSKRVDKLFQYPIGGFTGELLIINSYILPRLPKKDKIAFFIHETLRQISLMHNLRLSLEDIEIYTYSIVKYKNSDLLKELDNKLRPEYEAEIVVYDLYNFIQTRRGYNRTESDLRYISSKVKRLSSVLPRVKYIDMELYKKLSYVCTALYGLDYSNLKPINKKFIRARIELSHLKADYEIKIFKFGIGQQVRNTATSDFYKFAINNNKNKGYKFNISKNKWVKRCR